MSGGVVQLVATGPQDTWLTGKPEVSFYRSNYRRSTQYSSSVELQVIQGTPAPSNMSSIRIEKKGDLLNYIYLTATDQNGSTVPVLDWRSVISRVELYIGGQIIDTQDMEYMMGVEPVTGTQTASQQSQSVGFWGFFPLKFFFCKDWSASLPLVSLQFHDVEIRIIWSKNIVNSLQGEIVPPGNPTFKDLTYQAWANFVYLDQVERDWFAKTPQDILITQVQKAMILNGTTQEFSFSQPMKFLAFICKSYFSVYAGISSSAARPLEFKTQVNGVDVGITRSLVHWTDVPSYYNTPWGFAGQGPGVNIAIIPYCLDTSKLQPTGTLNFSRLDSYRIIVNQSNANGLNSLTPQDQTYHVLGVNYNILRIQNGLGSVLYAS